MSAPKAPVARVSLLHGYTYVVRLTRAEPRREEVMLAISATGDCNAAPSGLLMELVTSDEMDLQQCAKGTCVSAAAFHHNVVHTPAFECLARLCEPFYLNTTVHILHFAHSLKSGLPESLGSCWACPLVRVCPEVWAG